MDSFFGVAVPAPPEEPPLTLDEYQAKAGETADYPRVYTEDQVRIMLTRAYVRGSEIPGVQLSQASEWAEYDLNVAETSFSRLVYPILGLLGEAGELANKLKKVARDQKGYPTSEQEIALTAELGDVQWYVAETASSLDTSLGAVAGSNLTKLASRKERGVLHGDGDNR